MMGRWFGRSDGKLSLGRSAAILSGLSLITMFLGLFRERLLNANFGVESTALDAYRVAFKVPDFMFIVLVTGALSVTFIPVLSARLLKGNKASAWDLSSSLVNLMSMFTLAAAIFIMLFADPIVHYLLAPKMSPEGQDLAVMMMRLIAVNPFLFSISSILTSIQQTVGRFFFYALAPAVYNVSIIFGIVFLTPHYQIMGVVYGVIIGSILQMLVGAVGLIGLNVRYHFGVNWHHQGLRQVLKLLPKRSMDQGMDYIVNLVNISLANRTGVGMINAWEMAFTLHWVPINLIGVAISTAAFPQMSERINQGRPDLFKKEFTSVLSVIIWLALPVTAIAFFTRGYLVRLLVAEGNALISNLLGLLVLAIFFRAIFHLAVRAFYAQQDTKTPMYVSIWAIGLNIVLAIYLSLPWLGGLGMSGIAIATTVVSALEVIFLMLLIVRRFEGLFDMDFLRSMFKMVLAAGLVSVIAYAMVKWLPLRATDAGFFVLAPKFVAIYSVSLLSYLMISYFLRIKESKPVVHRIVGLIYPPMRLK
jgi:putative peptidoglycan lipid II flippase